MTLNLFNEKARNKTKFFIVQIGAGANGSHFFRSLCQDIATYRSASNYSNPDINYHISLCDGDIVEKKNLNNQLFDDEDIGELKVDALRERYSEHYNLLVQSIPEYVTSIELLQKLFTFPEEENIIPVLIGMLDNNKTRQLLDQFFYSDYLKDLIYIDAGVEGVYVVPGKHTSQYSLEEKAIEATSGFSGQIVVGYKRRGRVILPPVGRIFGDILLDEETVFPGQSCGDAIINNPQRCATNKFAAQLANNIMNTLFYSNDIESHVVNFNARISGANPTRIPRNVVKEYNDFMNNK
ncbi:MULTISPECIES: ThiF family adenylyltransferase [Bacillus]|uniref:ThiF family adenylyltransferase n=1 Tax=Bacillus TaxID=1386 RepID=UPI000C755D25|nr:MULTISPECIES: ThiF family adenylyltransferase [Bacillus]MCP1161381.1 ThiF family adenylyltransferase [Bacillus infantis]PLR70475.1 thiamine biosynthesis protein ThiF [Bacillus sp. UMB0728]